jgi:hypothetical protein
LALGVAADYGYCASHSRFFWGFRLHAIFALRRHPAGPVAHQPQARRARGGARAAGAL